VASGGVESFGGLSDADAETVGLDIKKAWQLSIGEVEEFKPQIQLEANPEVFADWCDWSIEHGSRVAIDIEADSVDPLTCKMTVVGLARRVREIPAVDPALEEAADTESAQQMEAHERSPKEVLAAGKPGTAEADGSPPVVEVMSFWWPNANERAREALRKLLADETIDKVFHNCSYDQMALERLIGPIKGGVSDTMLLSHARFPDVEVKLDAVAQTWLAVPPWKNEHYAREAARKAAVASAEQRGKKQKAAVEAGQGAFSFMGDEGEEQNDGGDEPDVKLEWSEERVMDLLGYNAMDVAVTSAIEPLLVDECEREKVLEIAAVDVALAQVGWRMTRDGVPLDQEVRRGLKKEIEMRVETSRARMWRIVEEGLLHPVDVMAADRLQKEIQRRGVFNPNADVMLECAFDVCGVKVPASKFSVTAKGKRSFGKRALAEIGDVPLVSSLSEYRGTTRLVSTFFGKDTMPIGPDGRMHVPWKIHGTPTGRWASGKEDADDDVVSINLQNWPGAMRKMVVAPPGMRFVGADFAQLEYRVVALLAGEISLLNLFNDPTRPDLHSTNAARLFGADWEATDPMKAENPFDKEKRKRKRYILRGLTKNGLYGAMYKGSAVTIQKTLQARSLKERDEEFAEAMRRVTKKQCQDFVDAIPRLWPAIEAWREWAIKDVAENQETICPLSGRRRIWPLGMADATQAINTRVQTFAGSLMNERFLYLSTALPKEARIILQVHDSVVIECPEAMVQDVLKITIDTMTTELEIGGNKCLFTVDGKIGNTWAEV
jgi:DNA polymerase I-like protein with 3'-5' exonuclease and polymerase domains